MDHQIVLKLFDRHPAGCVGQDGHPVQATSGPVLAIGAEIQTVHPMSIVQLGDLLPTGDVPQASCVIEADA